MKDFWTFVFCLITVIGVAYLSAKDFSYFKPGIPKDFTITKYDLNGKSITLPQGQIWAFNSDQNIVLNVLSQRNVDGIIVAIAEVNAIVRFPQDEKADKSKKNPIKVTLYGLVKLIYEKVNGSWYLMQIEDVNTKVTAE